MRSSAPPKTTASPGRPEKLPPAPALTGLLKGKSGSRSSRGSRGSMVRSSPMFVSRRKTTSEGEDGEPSSPKVTCMGQVRMRRKKNGDAKRKWRRQRCRCFEGSFPCFRWRALWRRVRELPLRLGGSYRRARSSIKEEEPQRGGDPSPTVTSTSEDEEEEEEEETRVFVPSAATTPPRNALLLMRCRSAPHNRGAPALPAEPAVLEIGGDESKGEEARGLSNGDGGEGEEKEKMMCSFSPSSCSHPLVLMRCKSEPARTAAKLAAVPETSFASMKATTITHQ
ncbi:hypothetical protein J5N97_014809 [Dioscorea zingiberensis]|uniref:Uncharacterized protein n=1 Tax=Dioscorea zingiberensis TaxID=325984 RepID=A0A9D5HJV3_9LILI|nr:hypothetical protein J5N97_014809 [Dioscorea zingiberensis]